MSRKTFPNISVLTGGEDRPYAFGIATAFIEAGLPFEFIGSNELDAPFLHNNPLVVFRNMRGDQTESVPLSRKIIRILLYYVRLVRYAVTAKPRIFHILWNNKFDLFDRTVLMLLYRACGRRIVLTVHNVNKGERDGRNSLLNRFSLWMQYRLSHALFVHTEKMSEALQRSFSVPSQKITIIPFPMNSTTPTTDLSAAGAREKLGLETDDKVLLFYGHIAPYKGLHLLVEALTQLPKAGRFRLVIAGRVKVNAEEYWSRIQQRLQSCGPEQVLTRIEFIPDEDTEIYFKAADALVLPYTYIFQSGVLFLSYNYGLPVLAADVGSLRDAIVEAVTGFVFRAEDSGDLARTIEKFFASDLYRDLANRRRRIRDLAAQRYSWTRVASVTAQVYGEVLGSTSVRPVPTQ